MQRDAVPLARDAGRRRADGAGDDREHRHAPGGVEAEVIAEQGGDAREREQRSGQLAPGDLIAGHVEVCERDRDDRQRGEQDCGQAAFEVLLGPVDEPVIGGE